MNVIKNYGKSILLEDETGFRFYVDKDIYTMYIQDEVEEDEFYFNSIPYSIVFSVYDEKLVDEDFYKLGIHTLTDILRNRQRVTNILRGQEISTERLIGLIKGENNE